MKHYTYWNNAEGWHTRILFECKANNILEADKMFEAAFNISPAKLFNISCSGD